MRAFRFGAQRGLTLIELLITSILLSVVFLGAATAYVTALKLLYAMRAGESQVYALTALERVVRTIQLSSEAVIGTLANPNDTNHIWLRLDYADPVAFTPNGSRIVSALRRFTYRRRVPYSYTTAGDGTAYDITDDRWVKFGIIPDPATGKFRLRWRIDPHVPNMFSSTPSVSDSDPEVEPGLVLAGGSFSLGTAADNPLLVNVYFGVEMPSGGVTSLVTSAMMHITSTDYVSNAWSLACPLGGASGRFTRPIPTTPRPIVRPRR